MQNLLAFVTKHFHWLVFLLLEIASVVMLFQYNSYQGSVWISSANLVTGRVYSMKAQIEQFFSLSSENERLCRTNLVLEHELAQLRALAQQGQEDAAAPAAQQGRTPDTLALIPAKVVANSIDKPDNLLTIDRGSDDGVERDMGVASGTGLVGVVMAASRHYAIVMPVLNRNSRISCTIRNRGYFGYLSWNGGSPVEAYMEDVPRHARFQRGDWVETSGYSAIFPPGISVGRITNIYNSADGLSYRLKVHLSTDFARLRDVCVINDKGLTERLRLQEATQDSLMLNN